MSQSAAVQIAPSRRTGIGLGLILAVQLMLILDMTVVNVALPKIRADLGFTPSTLSWVLNAYTLAFGGLLLLGGRLGDVFGRRRTFLAGVAVFALGSLVSGLAPDATVLVVSRALQGVGAAVAAPNVLALITTSAPDQSARNRALALFSAVSSAGGSLGLILGGTLTGYASWRFSLIVNVPIALVVLVLVPRFVDETHRQHGRFDLTGALTATAGSASLVFGFIHAPDHGWASAGTLGAFALAALLLATFVTTELRVTAPLLSLGLLRNPMRAGAVTVMALFVGAQFSFFYFMVQFMHTVLGYGALESGFAFLPLTVLIFATSRVTPRLVGALGVRPLVMTGLSLVTVSNLWLAGVDTGSTYLGGLLGPMVLTGIGAGLGFMPLTVAMLTGVDPDRAGSASGLLQMGQQVGGALGLAVLVTVYASGSVPGEVVPGLSGTFLTAAAFVIVALGLAGVLLRQRRGPSTADEAPAPDELELAA
ncbi:MFS transporter [Nocardioides terrisoli]|uniref:MFS transporter n=1 Tax=Nocardioides terrisoli TaxID=3388267 RepID=UPI00287B8DB1|nr:MFS transporter [Nocardioides marmorisolisilvae]